MATGEMSDILAAAKRTADKAFASMKKQGEETLFASSGAGRLSSSSHILAEKTVFLEGYEDLCVQVTSRVRGLISPGSTEFVEPVEQLLQGYWKPVMEQFSDLAGPGQPSDTIQHEINRCLAQLTTELPKALSDAMADFRLSLRTEAGDGIAQQSTIQSVTSTRNGRSVGFAATALRVMIASPGDVATERSIIREAIHEWNAVHAMDRSLVLLPVGWESHSSPAMGSHPQEIINKQVLRDCDVLVAVFWTRLGTPTPRAGSGTAEEISEHLAAGKPALLYFSSQPVRPDSVDRDQYEALMAFKGSLLERGLIEHYDTLEEFGSKFRRQLAQTVIREFESGPAQEAGVWSRDVEPPESTLSDAAWELLREAVKDRAGAIMRRAHMSGTAVSTNGKQFIPNSSPREVAKWRSAVDELEAVGFVEDRAGTGNVFFVTTAGYSAAETKGGE